MRGALGLSGVALASAHFYFYLRYVGFLLLYASVFCCSGRCELIFVISALLMTDV